MISDRKIKPDKFLRNLSGFYFKINLKREKPVLFVRHTHLQIC